MFTLSAPWWFLLLPLPWLLRPRKETPEQSLPRLPLQFWYRKLPHGMTGGAPTSFFSVLLLTLSWLLLLTALARPQLVDETITEPVTGRDLMLVIDLSPSMQERDMLIRNRAISRLEAVKRLGDDFIAGRQGDRLGLMVFSTTAHLYAPLTFDHATVRTFLAESFIGMAGNSTAIGDALGLAVKNLRENAEGDPVIILLTDGENNAGNITPEMAAELAEAANIRVHTIGVGSPESGRGLSGWARLRSAGGVDEALLQSIADRTGGTFFMARDMPTLEMIYQQLDGLEPAEVESRTYIVTRDLFHWPLALALVLMVFSHMPLPPQLYRRRPLPNNAGAGARHG